MAAVGDLIVAYLEMSPVSEIIVLIRALHNWPNVSAQEVFCQQVVHSKFKKFPPSTRWMRCLLKAIEKDVANSLDGMSDPLTELFLQNVAIDYAQDNEFCDEAFLTFVADDEVFALTEGEAVPPPSTSTTTIRVLRLHNDVGTRIWEAGLYMAEILKGCPELLARKTVVELGAGSGISTLLALKNCCTIERECYLPARAIITDHMPEVLNNLRYNVELNAIAECTSISHHDDDAIEQHFIYGHSNDNNDTNTPCLVSVQMLDFTTATMTQCKKLQAEVIIVADCTYSEDISDALVDLLGKLLNPNPSDVKINGDANKSASSSSSNSSSSNSSSSNSSSSNSSSKPSLEDFCSGTGISIDTPICLIAATIRNLPTYQYFVDILTASDQLDFYDVTSWAKEKAGEQRYRYDYRDSIRVLLIHGKYN